MSIQRRWENATTTYRRIGVNAQDATMKPYASALSCYVVCTILRIAGFRRIKDEEFLAWLFLVVGMVELIV